MVTNTMLRKLILLVITVVCGADTEAVTYSMDSPEDQQWTEYPDDGGAYEGRDVVGDGPYYVVGELDVSPDLLTHHFFNGPLNSSSIIQEHTWKHDNKGHNRDDAENLEALVVASRAKRAWEVQRSEREGLKRGNVNEGNREGMNRWNGYGGNRDGMEGGMTNERLRNAESNPRKGSRKHPKGTAGGKGKGKIINKRLGGDGQNRSMDPRLEKVQRQIVRLHNILRSRVNPPAADMLAVRWYDTAATQAQAWAEQCGENTRPDHPSVRWSSRFGACGQNVFISPWKRLWGQVMRTWWSGRQWFRFGHEGINASMVSSYTQMAWYSSHQLGCGFAECTTTEGKTFFRYVCNYCPSGNDPRRLSRPYTRGQSCRKCPSSCRSVCRRGGCRLCTNACAYSDLWVNCGVLDSRWHEWLCNTKTTRGVERFKNCRATCQCFTRIT